MVDALVSAAPHVLLRRYSSNPGHCVPASISGAIALNKAGAVARPLPCIVAVFHRRSLCGGVGIGSTPTERFENLKALNLPGFPPWETFRTLPLASFRSRTPGADGGHMLIEAAVGSARALIDLTSAQISTGTLVVPRCVVSVEGWPRFAIGEYEIHYGPTINPSPEDALARAEKCSEPTDEIAREFQERMNGG